MVATKELRRAVERGAKVLDHNVPGWHRRVKASKLKMSSCRACVMGQLFGNYRETPQEMFETQGTGIRVNPNVDPDAYLGFDIPIEMDAVDGDIVFNKMTDFWKEQIKIRKYGRCRSSRRASCNR